MCCLRSSFCASLDAASLFGHFSPARHKNRLFLTCVFREADAEWRLLDLLSEQILFVEEEDDGGVNKELVVADGVEQHQRLVHAILRRSLEEGSGGR